MKTKPFAPARRVWILAASSVVGQKEKQGPLGKAFDLSGEDRFGKDTWEKAEAEMQRLALSVALQKAGKEADGIDLLFAGDLVNQCLSSSFGLMDYRIPYLGLFGACSTCAEGMLLAAMAASSVCDRCVSVTSSHYCTAERQFRYPLEYGGQRTPTSQWTVTGAGGFVYSSLLRDVQDNAETFIPEITEILPGCIVDHGISDANNMGAAMAPAAADTLERYFASGHSPEEFDRIFTGDLSREGSAILLDLLSVKGYDLTGVHEDCGNLIYDPKKSDTHAGASGCGCSAVVMAADILKRVKRGEYKNILFLGTGALMNTLSVNQGQTIPGIAHLIHIQAANAEELKGKSETEPELGSEEGEEHGYSA